MDRTYGSKVDRIYRILLSRDLSRPSWYRIAKLADVSYGWAYRILTTLKGDKVIDRSRVRKPKRLFETWAGRPDGRVYREYHLPDPRKVLKGAKTDFALTGHFAENQVTGYLFPRYYDLYIHEKDIVAWHRSLVKNGYVGKGNVRIFLSDEHVFFERWKVHGWPIVSIQQLIVDLIREGAECGEAADMLIGRYYND